MASTDAFYFPKKNAAFRAYFEIFDNDGDTVSGAAGLDSEYSGDGAAFADCSNEATEIGTSGIYYLDLIQAEMDYDCTIVRVQTSTTNAKTRVLFLYTSGATQLGDDVADEEYDNDGTAISLRGAIKLILSVLTGKSSGGGTGTEVFRDIADTKDRISATCDANGNRTAVGTRDAT